MVNGHMRAQKARFHPLSVAALPRSELRNFVAVCQFRGNEGTQPAAVPQSPCFEFEIDAVHCEGRELERSIRRAG